MDDAQFELAMKEETTMDDLRELVAEKKRKSEEENRRREEQLAEQKRVAEEQRKELEKALGIYDGEEEPALTEGEIKDPVELDSNPTDTPDPEDKEDKE